MQLFYGERSGARACVDATHGDYGGSRINKIQVLLSRTLIAEGILEKRAYAKFKYAEASHGKRSGVSLESAPA